MQGWIVILVATVYLAALFAIASYGDRQPVDGRSGVRHPAIYPLALGVYCTSWTFFGSVGLASTTGTDFLTIYIGAGLMIAFGYPLLRRVVEITKAQNITSIADFIGARYGKSQLVAAIVTVIAIVGTVPYIALQLKAVSASLLTLVAETTIDVELIASPPIIGDVALFVALALAIFAILFGTRHIEATEHQNGLMLAIAVESLIKLAAFLTVGVFVTFVMFDGFGDLFTRAMARDDIRAVMLSPPDAGRYIVMTLLSFVCIVLLPRQFHVLVVENNREAELRAARWLFPAYLIAINIFVLPIAAAGMLVFGGSGADADMYVLRLPIAADADWVTIFTFIGGLSAATAMVIVATVAVSIMVANELVMPFLLTRGNTDAAKARSIGARVLFIRRAAILAILLLAYAYSRLAGESALASIGLLSFAAIAQLAPAFFGGLIWRGATARGAIAAMLAGTGVWFYTLMLPTLARAGVVDMTILETGPFGITMLRPEAILGFKVAPLVNGVFWSIIVNITVFVAVSRARRPMPIERLQAGIFVPTDRAHMTPGLRNLRASIRIDALKMAVAGYLGHERTDRAFNDYARRQSTVLEPNADADLGLLRYAERLLASAIGAASARIVLSLLLKRDNVSPQDALKLLDDASAAIQQNRDLLQTALDQVGQGIAVFNANLQLICWNRQFRSLLSLPPEFGVVGVPLSDVLRHCAESGELGDHQTDWIVSNRIEKVTVTMSPYLERLEVSGVTLEVRTHPMPDGGFVLTFSDVTERIAAQEALAHANATLERRVRERTEELTRANAALAQATDAAEAANVSKTRFLAAAGHDVMQPLNAARLYVSSMVENGGGDLDLVKNVDASLEAVEDILGALLDISKLDAGAIRAQSGIVVVNDLFDQLRTAFEPVARAKGIELRVLPCSLRIRSDQRLLRRVLQNLVSNAIKYTDGGRVIVGARRSGGRASLRIYDTGSGIPLSKQGVIFKEFQRLEDHDALPGIGLGLSIVERMCKVLDHPIDVVSVPKRGSMFAVDAPLAKAAMPTTVAATRQVAGATGGDLGGLRVLCIDNEARILDGMDALLSAWGCRVFKAADTREAVRLLSAEREDIDLILADYHLDRGTGLDAVVDLRWKFGGDLPAILVTADRTPSVRDVAAEKGVPVLHKPVKPAALRALINQLTARREAAE